MINETILPQYDEIWQQTLNWKPNSNQQQLFQEIYLEIMAANQFLNLTRITKPDEFWEKHIWDSLAPVLPLNLANQKVIDIGTGAGFPGIPVAIAFLNYQVTLLDSTKKKINFLESLITKLKLDNVNTLSGRAEAIAQRHLAIAKENNHREKYDLALIRAVGDVCICAEYALPFLKKDGIAILYRGNFTEEESKKLNSVVKKLGGIVEKNQTFTTPLTQGIRNCIYVKKTIVKSKKFSRLPTLVKRNLLITNFDIVPNPPSS